MAPAPVIVEVAAGVIEDSCGRVLISRRPAGSHAGGYWEFPGGKLAPGEAPAAALARELREELGIEVRSAAPLGEFRHDYPDRRVLLHMFRVTDWDGEPAGVEGQPLRWLSPAQLDRAGLLPADTAIVAALQLSRSAG